MSNGLALFIVVCIAGFFLVDALLLGGGAPLALARRGLDLLDWATFWR
jgi:hypothetical protein